MRRWRAETGFSLEHAGRLLGVAHTTVRDWERGRNPRDVHALQLRRVLTDTGIRCTIEDFRDTRSLSQATGTEPHPTIPTPTPLRLARINLGLTMKQFARQTHVCVSTLSLWERGLRTPAASNLPHLAATLRLPLEQTATLFEQYPPARPEGVTLPSLNTLRRQAGLTQRAFAAALTLSVPTLAAWESGHTRIPKDRLDLIAQLLGLSVIELLDAARRPRTDPHRRSSRLASLRRRCGLTQRQAAHQLGISARSMARIEAGQRPMNLILCRSMARIYKCTFSQVAHAASLAVDPLVDRRRWTRGSLSRVLTLLRAATGEPASQIAAAIGVHPATLRRWENGAATPSTEAAIRLERYFHLTDRELQCLLPIRRLRRNPDS